jgi:hypothetical protein
MANFGIRYQLQNWLDHRQASSKDRDNRYANRERLAFVFNKRSMDLTRS